MPPSKDGAGGHTTEARVTVSGRVAETFWMPAVEAVSLASARTGPPLATQLSTTVGRLRRGRRLAQRNRPGMGLRERMAMRRRRRLLGRLNLFELQNLAQIVRQLEPWH